MSTHLPAPIRGTPEAFRRAAMLVFEVLQADGGLARFAPDGGDDARLERAAAWLTDAAATAHRAGALVALALDAATLPNTAPLATCLPCKGDGLLSDLLTAASGIPAGICPACGGAGKVPLRVVLRLVGAEHVVTADVIELRGFLVRLRHGKLGPETWWNAETGAPIDEGARSGFEWRLDEADAATLRSISPRRWLEATIPPPPPESAAGLAACPFCGSHRLDVARRRKDVWAVHCGGCGATGPLGSELEARDRWASVSDAVFLEPERVTPPPPPTPSKPRPPTIAELTGPAGDDVSERIGQTFNQLRDEFAGDPYGGFNVPWGCCLDAHRERFRRALAPLLDLTTAPAPEPDPVDAWLARDPEYRTVTAYMARDGEWQAEAVTRRNRDRQERAHMTGGTRRAAELAAVAAAIAFGHT